MLGFDSRQPLAIMRAASASVRPVRSNSASTTNFGAPTFAAGVDDVFSLSDVYSLFLIGAPNFGAPNFAESAPNFGARALEIGALKFGAPMIASSSSRARSRRRGAG